MKRKTTKEFIEQAKAVHGDKYDYSKVEYTGSKNKACIICPKHGEFWQDAAKHLQGSGCPKCSGVKRLTTEEFIEKSRNIHGNKYNYNNTVYINQSTPVSVICDEHGEFKVHPCSHLSGTGCPMCKYLKKHTKNHSNYKSKRIIRRRISNIKEFLILKRKLWFDRFREIHGDNYKYVFCNALKQTDYIQTFCKKHNYWFWQSVVHHLHGNKCPICSGGTNRPYTNEEFIIKAMEVHGNLYNYDNVKYVNKDTPVEIICEKHGSFWQKPHNHINGGGCQTCKATKTQLKLFNLLKTSFPDEEWLWEYQTPWLGLQRFDIYNKRCNLAIEYNGEQHYKPIECFGGQKGYEFTVERDKLKIEKCKNNNCTLYTVKYDEFDNEKIIDDISKILKQ